MNDGHNPFHLASFASIGNALSFKHILGTLKKHLVVEGTGIGDGITIIVGGSAEVVVVVSVVVAKKLNHI